jgi:putative restriction endonuclease
MGFGVFLHRSDSIYDDRLAEQYQFPRQYRSRAEACVDDWIVYYEPRKVAETRGYFAVARVMRIIEDPNLADMYLALIEPGSYLEFPDPVPFSDRDGVVERGVLNQEGNISGRAQAAVRPVSTQDFNRIITLGLGEEESTLPRIEDAQHGPAFQEGPAPFQYEIDRDRAVYLTSRPVRDRAFRRLVLGAYEERCALTGLRLINGGGRAEVEAAHIRPVEAGGPDSVNNGIALCGTAHWMFDRGLISLTDNLEILISRKVNDADSVRSIINKNGLARRPHRVSDRPNPRFLHWHRTHHQFEA